MSSSHYAAVSQGEIDGRPRIIFTGSFVNFPDQVLRLLESEFPDFTVTRVSSPSALRSLCETQTVQVVVLQESFVDTAMEWRLETPVALAFHRTEGLAARLLGLGLDELPERLSFLPMNSRLDVWLSIMRLLISVENYVPVDLMRAMRRPVKAEEAADRVSRTLATPALPELTRREREVLPLIALGKPNKLIAEELAMSEHTVKLHVHHIMGKLGVRNRTEAARLYLARTRTER